MTTFKELFENLKKEIDATAMYPPDLNIYRRTAEEIALNGKSSVILIAIFLVLGWAATTFIEEVRISSRNHTISQQRMVLSTMGAEDSIIFNCRHCVWKHTLEIKRDSTINAPTY